jgi:hypothetical protein
MKAVVLFTYIILLSLLSGCSILDSNKIESLQIVSDKGANGNKITAVDIVFVYDEKEELPKTADEWFAGNKQRVLVVPEMLKIVSLRIPPALISEVKLPSRHSRAKKVVAYVKFGENGGQGPLDLTRFANPVILLKRNNYQLSRRRR